MNSKQYPAWMDEDGLEGLEVIGMMLEGEITKAQMDEILATRESYEAWLLKSELAVSMQDNGIVEADYKSMDADQLVSLLNDELPSAEVIFINTFGRQGRADHPVMKHLIQGNSRRLNTLGRFVYDHMPSMA